MNLRSAGLLYGPEIHHLDHLAIICDLMQAPLLVTDEEIANEANKYYPGLQVIQLDTISIASHLVDNFEVIFCTIPRLLFEEIFFFAQQLKRKKIHTIWCPHGNSDKGHKSLFMEALENEEIALVYGPRMIHFLMEKGVLQHLLAYITTGNIRYAYYLRHKQFYERIIELEVARKLPKAIQTFFYAPTWQDRENSSSFYEALPYLIDNLPENSNLIVKPHPNLLIQDEKRADRVLAKYEDHPHLLVLTRFAPIYPLLDYIDVYIGDMSSIGYDFLVFNKPMFFLNPLGRDAKTDPGLYLFRCGVEIRAEEYTKIYSIIRQHLAHESSSLGIIRRNVYEETFHKSKKMNNLRKEISDSFSKFPTL